MMASGLALPYMTRAARGKPLRDVPAVRRIRSTSTSMARACLGDGCRAVIGAASTSALADVRPRCAARRRRRSSSAAARLSDRTCVLLMRAATWCSAAATPGGSSLMLIDHVTGFMYAYPRGSACSPAGDLRCLRSSATAAVVPRRRQRLASRRSRSASRCGRRVPTAAADAATRHQPAARRGATVADAPRHRANCSGARRTN